MANEARRDSGSSLKLKRAAVPDAGTEALQLPHEALRDQLADVLNVAIRLADAVRSEGSIAMPITLDEPDPEAGPLNVKGFYEHFIGRVDDRISHRIWGYTEPRPKADLDPNLQFHLHELVGEAMAFNVYAQRAHMDEALGVALQSPDVPAAVDSLLVKAAFLTAVFDNLSARIAKFDGRIDEATLAYDKANLDRHLLIAKDKMLAPERFSALLPPKRWPFVVAERSVAPHDGDYFINLVYFPAEHAAIVLCTQKARSLEVA
ncbi:MAG: hypothetical protein JSS20_18815 [Proteobacteria bacterium]|nr:hypothetical protein [Pseudomonadota bacterium]